eukprot:COSAG01_NODE_24429_length_779_cov_1.166176_1_plen_58_part_10
MGVGWHRGLCEDAALLANAALAYKQAQQQQQQQQHFFKQKTAYEISECDWSSDVCSSD